MAENAAAFASTGAAETTLVEWHPSSEDDLPDLIPFREALGKAKEDLRREREEKEAVMSRFCALTAEHARTKRDLECVRQQLGGIAVDKSWPEALSEYIAWGRAAGGRGGRCWSEVHARMTAMRLRWWSDRLGTPQLSAITLSAVEQALAAAPGSAPKTKHDYAAVLRGFLSWCRRHGYLGHDPLAQMGHLDSQPVEDWRALTVTEIQSLLRVAPPHRRLLYELAVSSGLRIGELAALRVRHLDATNSCLRPDTGAVKNKKRTVQPLPQILAAKLALTAKGKGSDTPLVRVPNHYTENFWTDRDRAGIAPVMPEGKAVFHSLRKSYTTLLQELAGASLSEAQKLSRHSTPVLTSNIYTKTGQQRLLALVDALGSKLLA